MVTDHSSVQLPILSNVSFSSTSVFSNENEVIIILMIKTNRAV